MIPEMFVTPLHEVQSLEKRAEKAEAEVERLRAAMIYAMSLPYDTCESVYCILQDALERK